ncbi:hypothetical protein JCM5296_004477 [Sporobolomyces johnsonii]
MAASDAGSYPSSSSYARRSRPSPAGGKPGFSFPPHPYAAATNAQPRARESLPDPSPEGRLMKERELTPEERHVGCDSSLTQLQPRGPPAVPLPALPLPVPPQPAAAFPPYGAPRLPAPQPGAPTPETLAGPLQIQPSFTVSDHARAAAPPPLAIGSDNGSGSYRAHDSPTPFRAFNAHQEFPQQRPQQLAVYPRTVAPAAGPPRSISISPPPSLDVVSTQDTKAGSSFGGFDDFSVGEEGSGRRLRKKAAIWLVALALIIAICVGAGVGVSKHNGDSLVRPRPLDEFSFFRLCRLLRHLARFQPFGHLRHLYDPLPFGHVFRHFDHVSRPFDHVFWPFELNRLVFHLPLYLAPLFHFSKVGNPGQGRHYPQQLYLHRRI